MVKIVVEEDGTQHFYVDEDEAAAAAYISEAGITVTQEEFEELVAMFKGIPIERANSASADDSAGDGDQAAGE